MGRANLIRIARADLTAPDHEWNIRALTSELTQARNEFVAFGRPRCVGQNRLVGGHRTEIIARIHACLSIYRVDESTRQAVN